MFRADGRYLTIKLRDCANPRSFRELTGCSFDELNVRQAHIPRVMDDLAIFHHYENGVSVAHFNFVVHLSRESFARSSSRLARRNSRYASVNALSSSSCDGAPIPAFTKASVSSR